MKLSSFFLTLFFAHVSLALPQAPDRRPRSNLDVPIGDLVLNVEQYILTLADKKTYDLVEGKIAEDHGVITERFDGELTNYFGFIAQLSRSAAEEIRKIDGVTYVEKTSSLPVSKVLSQDVELTPELSEIANNTFTSDYEEKEYEKRDKKAPETAEKKDISVSEPEKAEWQTLGGILSWGQGYNSHLEEGLVQNVVRRFSKVKRARRSIQAKDSDHLPASFFKPDYTISDTIKVEPNGHVWLDDDFFDSPNPPFDDQEIDDPTNSTTQLVRRQKGQGSVDLQPIKDKAVLDESCTAMVYTHFYYVSDYHEYLHALSVSSAATITGWFDNTKITGNYLDQTKIDSTHITFIAVMRIERKEVLENGVFNYNNYDPKYFAQTHGDTFIKGMRTGGELIIRLNFLATNGISKTKLKSDVETILDFWVLSADITGSFSDQAQELSKYCEVDVAMFQKGNLEKLSEMNLISSASIGSLEAVFKQMKAWADNFRDSTCKHNYPIGPITDKYKTLENFPKDQVVPNYKPLVRRTNNILESLVKARNVMDAINLKYSHDNEDDFPDGGADGLYDLRVEYEDLAEKAQTYCEEIYTTKYGTSKDDGKALAREIYKWGRKKRTDYVQ